MDHVFLKFSSKKSLQVKKKGGGGRVVGGSLRRQALEERAYQSQIFPGSRAH